MRRFSATLVLLLVTGAVAISFAETPPGESQVIPFVAQRGAMSDDLVPSSDAGGVVETPAEEAAAEANKWTLPQPCVLEKHKIVLGGWVQQGITFNGYNPADGFNGIVGFNDLANQYGVNQANIFLKRDTDTSGGGFDWGGRTDVLFGTDGRFLQCVDGLEANWGQTAYYQMALPQFYLDLAYQDWVIRMGHFYTPHGYEVCTSPDNFFYSHALTTLYGEPFTHFGMMAIYKFNDQLSITNGFTRGNDKFDDTLDGINALGYLGAINWNSADKVWGLTFNFTSSLDTYAASPVNIYSLIGKVQITEQLQYVIQHDYGQSSLLSDTARWYGLNNYFLYKMNDKWSAGLRAEWFYDNSTLVNGRPVTGLRPGNALYGVPLQGDFWEMTAGVNWKPNGNWTIRPEIRYDWTAAQGPQGQQAFNAGTAADQFLFGIDAIVTF